MDPELTERVGESEQCWTAIFHHVGVKSFLLGFKLYS